MTRSTRFYLLLIPVLLIAASAPSQTQGGVEILLAKARSLEARGLMDLAIQNWRKVLLVNPDQTEALAGLARGAKEDGQNDEERGYLDRLGKINPHDPQIAAVEKLRVFTPEERNRLDEAGRLAMQHKPDQAMVIYRQVLGDQLPPPGKWAQPFYETEAAASGGREKAISQLRQLCAQNPNQEAYRMWLASLLTYDPKTRMEGLSVFASIKDSGTVDQARAPWRQALLWEKENLDALPAIEAYLERYPDPDLQSIEATLHAKQQQNIADADKQRGFNALENKDIGTAEAKFTEVLRQSPNDANAITGLGFVRIDQKRFSEALILFQRAHAVDPQRQDVRNGLDTAQFWLAIERGAAAQQQNQPEAAVLAYQDALTLRPSDDDALLGIANALVRERKFAEAGAKFQQVLNQAPNNADAVAGLGFVQLNEGHFADAQRLLAQARQLNPARKDVDQGFRNAKFWGIMNQAATALNQHRTKDAIAAYQRAVSLNPSDKDALLGLANASMRAGDFPQAAKTYYGMTAANPNDESNWLGLIQAQIGEKVPEAAISTAQHIPPAVKQRMEARADYLAEMALAYYDANQPTEGDQALHRAMEIARNSDTEDALSLRLQIAGASLEQGKTGLAIEIFKQATLAHPDNPNGWEGLVGAYTRVGEFDQAITAVRSIPEHAYDAAVKDTGFLNSVAVLYSSQGQCQEAEDFLNRSLALDQSQGRQPTEGTQLQLADIWTREHNYSNARDLYGQIVTRHANSTDAWRGYLAVLHQQRADQTLVAEIPRIPPPVRQQLEADPNFIVLEASAYLVGGKPQDALPLLREARSRYTAQHKNPPADLDIQLAWTMLAVSLDEPGLSDLLLNAKRQTNLTSKQHDAIEEIYSTWSVRRAERAFAINPQLAFGILTDAAREYPGDRNIHSALASMYLNRNEKEKALAVFQTWGMSGAQAGDYRVAAGAALSTHKNDLAEEFMREGLERFPHDADLMHMTAREEIARGDYDAGEQELKSALIAVREQNSTESQPETLALKTLQQNAEAENPAPAQQGSGQLANSPQSTPSCRPETARNSAGSARIRPIALNFALPYDQNQAGQGSSGQNAVSQAPVQKQEQQMEDEVEAVDNRNTPIISTGEVGTGRVGDPGFDRLIISDNLLGAAYTESNRLRFGVEGHGVYAYSGTPDGSSALMFGTLPVGAVFGEQSKIGYSGIAQLSTDTFGVEVGTSPQGFAVHNIIGGIRYRPLNGSLTFLGVRDSVKDSLLSYAGSRDPGTGIRWGGVVANTGTVKFDSAPSSNTSYNRIGEYASASASFIQGLRVPDNWSVSGNAGLYWQVVQGFTVGVNGTGMHDDKNLNFFSFGQGGYFSPQQYYLASIPISWYSRHARFEYQVKFSGGVQHLVQDASPFYPVLPGNAVVTPGAYAASNSTAPNYDADFRMGYRIAPHTYFDMFATANNASNYYTQSVGFNLRFTVDRIPTSTDLRIKSIPDWTGKQPFAVQ